MHLNVLHAPVIEPNGPAYVQARAGEEVEITCSVAASPAPHVDWYRNDRLLAAEDTVTAVRGDSYTLIATAIGDTIPVLY